MKRTDLMLGLYILVPIIFLIIPIPLFLLDILMMLNLAIALFILFNALFSTEALNMSSFPTLLLMTTLFRISLNVGSTRNILLKGEAGNVVQAFGEFVGGGNLIVGGIVFLILIIVQFIVINKGSERVSEVTARFTLDAMPGKQMAIDADLNTGAITDEQAKERRQKIQDESTFFGAMDGASKYVKGDATAGLIITVINFVGGLAIGVMSQGLEDRGIAEIFHTHDRRRFGQSDTIIGYFVVNRCAGNKSIKGVGSWKCVDHTVVFDAEGIVHSRSDDGVTWIDAASNINLLYLCNLVHCCRSSYRIGDGSTKY